VSLALASFAQRDEDSRGRRHAEAEHRYRTPYARDRDRIIHSRAFRRLEYKTQVFVNHEGDHYRTRLTHSIEVAQIARTVAKRLGLNSDLAETLALCHDMGHTPFGHLGEEVLDPLLAAEGGFSHNRQALRIVELLEERYPEFPGLNLTWETREGIVKHSGPPDLARIPESSEYEPQTPPPLEAQMIDLVDEIAYNHHDIEDGLESRLLSVAELSEAVPLFGRPYREAASRWPAQGEWMWAKIALRRVIDQLVSSLGEAVEREVRERRIESVAAVRAQPEWIVWLEPTVAAENRQLKTYLQEKLYRHPRIQETKQFFSRILRDLFQAYVSHPDELPARFQARTASQTAWRSACDYIAGMTDRFALKEHQRLCGGPGPEGSPFATR
jgi:dGTPase